MDNLGFDINAMLKQLESEAASPNAGNGKKHILVVDDDRTMLRTIKGMLENDYNVTSLANGKEVMRFFEKKTADLILLDYEMPGFSGVEVLRTLRDSPKTHGIPVIFITGINDTEKIREALSLGPRAYLLKPIDAQRLKAEIRKIIR